MADQMGLSDADRFARTLARYRVAGSAGVTVAQDLEQRALLDVLGIVIRAIWTPTGCGRPRGRRARSGCGFRWGFSPTPVRALS